MLRVNFLGRFFLEGVGGGNFRRGDDGTRAVGVGDGSFAALGFGADATPGVVVGGHDLAGSSCLRRSCLRRQMEC